MRRVVSDAIEKVFVSLFYYLGYRGFSRRVQVLPNMCWVFARMSVYRGRRYKNNEFYF